MAEYQTISVGHGPEETCAIPSFVSSLVSPIVAPPGGDLSALTRKRDAYKLVIIERVLDQLSCYERWMTSVLRPLNGD